MATARDTACSGEKKGYQARRFARGMKEKQHEVHYDHRR